MESSLVKISKVLTILILLVVSAAAFATAALALPPAAPRLQQVPAPGEYVLGADDVVDIAVANHEDLNTSVTVRPDGKISLPRAGEVQAAGKTAKALASAIEFELGKTLNHARVTVTVKEVNSRHARIIGAVKASGTFVLKPGWRLMDLIAVAGGLSTKPTRITGRLIRSGEVLPFNIEQAVLRPESPDNLVLEPNDLVVLDEQNITRQIHVVGQVSRPGAYDLEENLSIVTLMAETGGPTEKAALRQAHILRGGTQVPVDLQGLLVDGKTDDPMSKWKFQAGDILVVPENQVRFAIMGQVAKPGYYPLPEKATDATLLKVLTLAGGNLTNGDLSKATITRIIDGKATVVPVNIAAMVSGSAPDNISLRADDVLFIPEMPLRQVHVIGKVNRTGAFDLKEGFTLINLISEIGNPGEGAALSKAYILRNGQQIPLNLHAALVEGRAEPTVTNFKLQPGDVLVVPENQLRYAVMGQVARPGYYPFPEGKTDVTALSALGEAGGSGSGDQGGDLKNAGIIRKVNGTATLIPVNIEDVLKKGNLASNVALQPDDILYVPTKKKGFKWTDILQPIAALSMFGIF